MQWMILTPIQVTLLYRPKENEKVRDQLEKAVHIIWNCRLPSPRVRNIKALFQIFFASPLYMRKSTCSEISNCYTKQCVAIDAVKEVELVSALKVSMFPEIIFTKAGKILYREKGNSSLLGIC